jgi:lipopolysaccharide/colanic/teichoic acid biosynthesis glycosyltransferase
VIPRNGPAVNAPRERPGVAAPSALPPPSVEPEEVQAAPGGQEQAAAERTIALYADLASHTPRRLHPDVVIRCLDCAIAGGALLVLSPALLLAAAAIRLSSGPPVLYRGLRVGRFGRVFTMYKFRTLRTGAEARLGGAYGAALSARTEDEVTAVGRWLRASQLDEMPQLWNVVRGDMSIVGPRPVRPAFFEDLVSQVPAYWQRLVVRPGLSGFAQTRMTREVPWEEKLAHDLEYIADRSVRLYVRVVAATAWRILRQSLSELAHLGRRRVRQGADTHADA